MEPVDLKPSDRQDDPLEAWLRANAATTPLPDAGFTARVLTSLPPPAKASRSHRAAFCLAGALIGAALPWLTGTSLRDLGENATALRGAALPALQQFADPNLALALIVTGLCLLYVFKPRGRLLPRS